MDSREEEHHWTGETTVVRLAREAGFGFMEVLDDLWHETKPFVLVFHRPLRGAEPEGDPDRALPLGRVARNTVLRSLSPDGGALLFVGLDEGRAVLPLLSRKPPAHLPQQGQGGNGGGGLRMGDRAGTAIIRAVHYELQGQATARAGSVAGSAATRH